MFAQYVFVSIYMLRISQFQLRPAPKGRYPRTLAFFALDIWQFPAGGDSWAAKSPGVEKNKESKCPVLHQHCNIFIDHTVESCHILSILICDFLFQLTSAFVIELTILIKTSRHDDTSLVSLW